MAMHDWNHDGRKGGIDDFFEYRIIHKDYVSGSNRAFHNAESTGIIAFGAAFSFVLAILLYTVCDIDVKDTPVVITIFLWGWHFLQKKLDYSEKRQYRNRIVGKWQKNIAIDRRKEYTISDVKIVAFANRNLNIYFISKEYSCN